MADSTRLVKVAPFARSAKSGAVGHTGMHQQAQRIKRLLLTKSQFAPGRGRLVMDAEVEPYRVYYRRCGAINGDSDEGMLRWFDEQAE